jgi:hypothetical protein
MAVTGAAEPGLRDGVIFLAGFISGAAVWCVGAAAAIGWGRRFIGPSLVRWIGAFSGLALGYFGLRLLWETAAAVLERPAVSFGHVRRAAELAHLTREARRAAP